LFFLRLEQEKTTHYSQNLPFFFSCYHQSKIPLPTSDVLGLSRLKDFPPRFMVFVAPLVCTAKYFSLAANVLEVSQLQKFKDTPSWFSLCLCRAV
jgi:hypothetical protein